ncbi:MAG: hypothetical protein ACTSWY_06030 [Promethearchaeota archaeon]
MKQKSKSKRGKKEEVNSPIKVEHESEGTVLLELKQQNTLFSGKKSYLNQYFSSKFTRYRKKISKIDLNHQKIIRLCNDTILYDEPTVYTYILGVLGEYEYPIREKNKKKQIFLEYPKLLNFLLKTFLIIDDFLVIFLAFYISSTENEEEIQNLTEFIRYIYLNSDDPNLSEDLMQLESQFAEVLQDRDIMDYLEENYEIISIYKIKNRFEVNTATNFDASTFLESMALMGILVDVTKEKSLLNSRKDNEDNNGVLNSKNSLFPIGSDPYYYLIKNQNNDIFQVFQFNGNFYLLDDEELLEWTRYSNPNLILDINKIQVTPKRKKRNRRNIIEEKKRAKKKKDYVKKEKKKKKKTGKKPVKKFLKLTPEKGVNMGLISPKSPKLTPKKDLKNLVFHEFSKVVKKYEKKMERKRWNRQSKRGDKITTIENKRVCLVHKGKIEGLTYICQCGALYCLKCAKSLDKKNEKCWNCGAKFVID